MRYVERRSRQRRYNGRRRQVRCGYGPAGNRRWKWGEVRCNRWLLFGRTKRREEKDNGHQKTQNRIKQAAKRKKEKKSWQRKALFLWYIRWLWFTFLRHVWSIRFLFAFNLKTLWNSSIWNQGWKSTKTWWFCEKWPQFWKRKWPISKLKQQKSRFANSASSFCFLQRQKQFHAIRREEERNKNRNYLTQKYALKVHLNCLILTSARRRSAGPTPVFTTSPRFVPAN